MIRVITIVAIVAAVIAGGLFYARRGSAGAPTEKTQYKIAKAEVATVKKTVSATGTLQPWAVVDIKSKAGGRVDALLVDTGSLVKKDQIIARIDPSDTLLSVNTAQADIDSAMARKQQSDVTAQLQVQQTEIAILNARAALNSSNASRNAAKARLDSASATSEAQPMLTEAAINTARANLNQAIEARRTLDATNPQQIASARAAYDQAKANLVNAKANVQRQKLLLDKGFVSQQVVDTAQAAYEVADAQVDSSNERVKQIEGELKAGVDSAEARVAQARAQLANAEAAKVDIKNREQAVHEAEASLKQADAQVKQAQAVLEQAIANKKNNEIKRLDVAQANASIERAKASMTNAKITLDQTTVRAPVDGVILKKYVEQGTMISSALSFAASGNSIVQVGDVTRMYVDVTVDETDIANVEDDQTVDVTIEAYPGIPFEGKVKRIDPQADVVQNVTTFHVRVEIDNSQPTFRLLKPGMNATCEFVKAKKENVLSIPNEAVRSDDNGKFVEIAKGGKPWRGEDGKSEPDPSTLTDVTVVRQKIDTDLEGNESTEVKSGLKDGDVVITQHIEPTPKTSGSPFGGGRMGGFGGGGRR